jgi:TldD protein
MIEYTESRQHDLSKRLMLMIDGHLSTHQHSVDSGRSVRVRAGGYWGFAASPSADPATLETNARRNAAAMSHFGPRATAPLPGGAYQGAHRFAGRPELSPEHCSDQLAALHAHCRQRYPDVLSTRLMLLQEQHLKHVSNSLGADAHSAIQRTALVLALLAKDERGTPIEVSLPLSCKGSAADLEFSVAALDERIDALHTHLQAKRHAVAPRGGEHTLVLGPALAGILAHEAMGHPCEADIVLGGASTADLLGQRVASDLVTMVDFAHHAQGQETLIPVYADDEGTPAQDAVLIERGMLRTCMSSRETAQVLGCAPTGNARAYAPGDEPLVRMRNTAILPGNDKLADMIAGVDNGYLLLTAGNGQADSTTEFMFGVKLGYEIRDGRVGRAIRDTTLSGRAIDMLQTVDAVSDDMHWIATGYCGKKQPMVVSFGGPALRARAKLGGE